MGYSPQDHKELDTTERLNLCHLWRNVHLDLPPIFMIELFF